MMNNNLETVSARESRRNKKTTVIITVAAGCLILLLANFHTLWAFCNTAVLAVVDYSPRLGVLRSPFVGIENISEVLSAPYFGRIVGNSAMLGLFSMLLTCILAFVLILCISRMKKLFVKVMAIAVIALPFFLPIAVYTDTIMKLFPLGARFEPQTARIIVLLIDTFRFIWVPVALGVIVCEHLKNNNTKTVFWLTGCIALFKLATLFMFDIEIVLLTYQPTTFETLNIFGTLSYRVGLQAGDASMAGAVDMVNFMTQLPVLIGGAIGLYFMAKCKKRITQSVKTAEGANIWCYIGYALIATIPLFIVISVFCGFPQIHNSYVLDMLLLSIGNSIVMAGASAIYCGVLTLVLTYPLFYSKRIYYAVLILIASIVIGFIGEYLVLKSMRWMFSGDAVLPIAMNSGFNITAILCLYFTVSSRYRDRHIPTKGEYLKDAIVPIIIIMTAVFIATYGGYIWQMILIRGTSKITVGIMGGRDLVADLSGTIDDSKNVLEDYHAYASIFPIAFGMAMFAVAGWLKSRVLGKKKELPG